MRSPASVCVRPKGNPWLAAILGEVVAGLTRTNTFLVLSDPESRFHDLGADYHETRTNPRRRQRDLIRQLEHLTGHTVVLRPTA